MVDAQLRRRDIRDAPRARGTSALAGPEAAGIVLQLPDESHNRLNHLGAGEQLGVVVIGVR